MSFRLDNISNFLNTLPSAWRVIGVIVALASLLTAFSTGIRAQLDVPASLRLHMQQADTIIMELRRGNHIAEQNQCITTHPRTAWVDCLRN